MDVLFFLISMFGHGDVQNYGCCCFDTFVSTARLTAAHIIPLSFACCFLIALKTFGIRIEWGVDIG